MGLKVSKMTGAFAVVVSCNGTSVPFPIVSDEHAWRETSPEEAFYCAVTDSFAWCSARPGEAQLSTLDAVERSAFPTIERDLQGQLARVREFAEMLGGVDALRRMWEMAGIDADVAASIDLRQK